MCRGFAFLLALKSSLHLQVYYRSVQIRGGLKPQSLCPDLDATFSKFRFLIVLTKDYRGVYKIQVQSHISWVWKHNTLVQALFPGVFHKANLFSRLLVGWQRGGASHGFWDCFGFFFQKRKEI